MECWVVVSILVAYIRHDYFLPSSKQTMEKQFYREKAEAAHNIFTGICIPLQSDKSDRRNTALQMHFETRNIFQS